MSGISFSVQFKVIRKESGTYDEYGRYIDGISTEFFIDGSIQPINQYELLNLEEAQRLQGTMKIYSEIELKIRDRIEYKGILYEVQKINDHSDLFLAHYKSIITKVPDDEQLRKAL